MVIKMLYIKIIPLPCLSNIRVYASFQFIGCKGWILAIGGNGFWSLVSKIVMGNGLKPVALVVGVSVLE